jgi:uncharacterized protein YbjT (DUF2867 family)
MKIAVTGASGFLGGAVLEILQQRGIETVAVSRSHGISLEDTDKLRECLSGCSGVIHCAGINREIGSQTYARVHVEGTRHLVELCRELGIPKFTTVSFLRARPDCGSAYHESKWEAEQVVLASGLDYTILRPGVIYGRGDHMLDHLSCAFMTFPLFGLVGMGKDRHLRPIAVREVASILVESLSDERLSRQTLSVTGPEELTLTGAVKRVAGVMGKRPLFFRLPVWAHYILARVCEAVMKVPMISLAQVRILSESLVEPSAGCRPLPADLAPRVPFSQEEIAKGLPKPRRFGFQDLLWS